MKARPLQPGGTIGVAAASSPFEERSEIDRSIRWYEERGYRVKLADGVYARDDFVAGDPKTRARDVNALFANPEVDVVQLLRGGYGASQVVPHLDYDLISANPKPLVGYSDVTALHIAIRQRTGMVTFYGPGFTGMGSAARGDWSKDRFLRALTDPAPLGNVPARPDDSYIGGLGSGRATAPLVGGCLWLLRETLATPWEIELDGAILFFEDVHCPPWHVDGMLTQLHNAGKLAKVAGVAIGEMHKCEEWRQPESWLRSRSMEDVFEHHLEPLGIPVVHNLPLGHGEHLCTIPLGVTATVDADARQLVIEEPALEGTPTPERSRPDPAPAASR
jgi:muramoyltetrapeptide carboxypeptidase